MRPSDRRREEVVAALGDGYAQGRLGTETLGLRVEAAFAARSEQELGSLVADLPRRWWERLRALVRPERPVEALGPPTVWVAPPPDGPGPWTIGRSDACRLVIDPGGSLPAGGGGETRAPES